ncbi:MAG: hypothetical protein ACRD2Z_11515 [Thermoanaerobaculia bacterium]
MATTEEPIEELRDFAVKPPAGFLQAVRRRLNRRLLVQQAADLSWRAWIDVLRHYLELILAALPSGRPPK